MGISPDRFYDSPSTSFRSFSGELRARLVASAKDPNVAGFKSVVCYRTGLDVSVVPDPTAEAVALFNTYQHFQTNAPLRLADKPLNDLVVRTTLEVAAEHNKPGMFFSSFSFLRPNTMSTSDTLQLSPPCSTVSYRSRRRGYHVNACEPGPHAAADCSKPSDHVRAAARQLPVYARGELPYGGVRECVCRHWRSVSCGVARRTRGPDTAAAGVGTDEQDHVVK